MSLFTTFSRRAAVAACALMLSLTLFSGTVSLPTSATGTTLATTYVGAIA